jgi:hypothetical protein
MRSSIYVFGLLPDQQVYAPHLDAAGLARCRRASLEPILPVKDDIAEALQIRRLVLVFA